jgi:nicotinate-nucleotide adenylyltransferase
MKIAIFGGTFNPVHNGHLAIARAVLKYIGAAQILFVPCRRPYHKGWADQPDSRLVPGYHRLEMIKQASRYDLYFDASDIDLKRKGPTYSIDTVHELKKIHPSAKFFFIIGADTLAELHQWHKIGELMQLVRFVVAPRPGYNLANVKSRMPFPREVIKGITRYSLEDPRINVSSTQIRALIREGKSIKNLVPPEVEEYISRHRLYHYSGS